MSGHDQHPEEDPTVPMKVGIILICIFIAIALIATL
jgi:hypothetical protein